MTADEIEKSARWDAQLITKITGGGKVKARFMRQDFFEFIPQCTLFIAGNHKPGLDVVNDAIKRRLRLIVFPVKISEEEKDPHLTEKLAAEADGILAWAIEGCLAWQRDGLKPPKSVLEATQEYFEQENDIGMFVEYAGLIADKESFTPTSWLYSTWALYAKANGLVPGSKKSFGKRLEEASGFKLTGKREYYTTGEKDAKPKRDRGYWGIKFPDGWSTVKVILDELDPMGNHRNDF